MNIYRIIRQPTYIEPILHKNKLCRREFPRLPTPETIIRESRELEWVAVDLGPDRSLTYEQRILLLADLATQIKASSPGTIAHAKLIDRYNTNLYSISMNIAFHQTALPGNSRIDDEYTLIEYLEIEQSLQQDGLYTLDRLWSRSSVVGHIYVRRLSWLRRGQTTVDCRRIFKGTLPDQSKLSFYNRMGNLYEPRVEYIVFWSSLAPQVSGTKMKVVGDGDDRVLRSGLGQLFWPFDSVLVSDFETEVSWEDLINWLNAQKSRITTA